MQTGQYSYMRVRPAAAGEGRYFVRVPEGWLVRACGMVCSASSAACVQCSEHSAHTLTGTNSGRFKLEEPEEVDPDSTSIETPDSDPLDAERTRVFFQWLQAREEDGYEGNLDGMLGWRLLSRTHAPPGA